MSVVIAVDPELADRLVIALAGEGIETQDVRRAPGQYLIAVPAAYEDRVAELLAEL